MKEILVKQVELGVLVVEVLVYYLFYKDDRVRGWKSFDCGFIGKQILLLLVIIVDGLIINGLDFKK